jgi:NADH-quinone oxidoreductase subunit H
MWVRWTVPRFRYDQIMKLGWQKLLPLAIANLIFYALAIAFIQK